MEANKELQQSKEVPLILAFENDSQMARELAAFLKCPLIDQNDITKALLNLSKTQLLPLGVSQNLPFEVVCEIASTQLSLKIKVVINSTLSHHKSHIDKLVELASFQKAQLIIVESKAKEEDDGYVYGDGQILKLDVNKDSFDVEKVVSEMSNLLLHQKEKEESQNEIKIKQPKNNCLHALSLLENPRKNNLVCNKCSELLFGPFYHCEECDEFTLHKSCAELAPNVELLSSQNCPAFFNSSNFDQYDFRGTYKCKNCEEFSDDCCDCLLQTHLNHGFLPTILYDERHPHPLNFVIMPLRYNYQYLCCICNKLGNSISYKCLKCYDSNYDVHVNCILPHTINIKKNKDGQQHYCFLLNCWSFSSRPNKRSCDICSKEIENGQLFYECKDVDEDIHFKCMLALITKKSITDQETIDESHVDALTTKKRVKKYDPSHFSTSSRLRNPLYLVPELSSEQKLRELLKKYSNKDNDDYLSTEKLIDIIRRIDNFPLRRQFQKKFANDNIDGYIDEKELDELVKFFTKHQYTIK